VILNLQQKKFNHETIKHFSKMKKTKSIIASVALAIASQMIAADGINVNFTGDNTCMVKVSAQGKKFIMLPVEEAMPDATINVLVNGNLSQTIYVRLAVSKIDYYVPFDISQYHNDNVVLDVRTDDNASRARSHSIKNDVCWNKMSFSDTYNTDNTEKYRPLYHHTPLYGWMNDPNGMVYKDGVWHLYYQYNPYGSRWQNMHWGHSTSTDLVNWEHHPIAIAPNGLGSVFSGSCTVDKNNSAGFGKDAIVALFTSAGACQVQSLAHSDDNGETFKIYDGNPVIAYERESRDPNMFWNESTGKWNLTLAGAQDHEILIFSSSDLKEWTLESSFGRGYGCQYGVWECPDLMQLPVRGSNEKKWVLVCNINPGGPFGGSATQYFVGDFDGKTFKCNSKQPQVTKWMDYGMDHYATVSWSNAPQNRHTVIAWMSNWLYANDVPTMQFRSANSLPRELGLFRDKDGEYYVSVTPSPELIGLRGEVDVHKNSIITNSASSYKLPTTNDGACEIVVELDLNKSKVVDLMLSNSNGEEVVMTYDITKGSFAMNREKSGVTDFSTAFPCTTIAPLHSNSSKQTLRLFIDRCSIEAFDGNGRFAMTNLVFPTSPYTDLSISTPVATAKLNSLNIYQLKIK
jgi:sucrose-6-phosphate hydrolase SacC (GH32 family)